MAARPHWLAVAAGLLATELAAETHTPLSAIDWLNQTPTVTLDITGEPPVAEDGDTPDVAVDPLDDTGRDAVGLLPSSVTGLPANLWQASRAERLAELVNEQSAEALPAIQALTYTLLLAEANPPFNSAGNDALLLARVDQLMAMGAIEQAHALLQRANPSVPHLFQRWFDVSLLLGEEQEACTALLAAPRLTDDYASRIFCQARAGDWTSAALTLNSAQLLGLISEEEDALLLRFLDPELFEGEPLLVRPTDPNPLKFRLYEAIGETLATTTLPRAFAHIDIGPNAGWKAQLDAAERLARSGALPENRLFGIYTDRRPAASGGVWDRVAAVQAFDRAIAAKDARAVAKSLESAWIAMRQARLEVSFARFYGPALEKIALSGNPATLAREILLLSPNYETVGQRGPKDYFAGLATGTPPRRADTGLKQAVSDAFHGAGVPQTLSNHLARGQLGEVILQTMTLFSKGAAGDLPALTHALATFRAIGLEDTARQAALQVLLLERGF
ncbi:hypothetical protein N6L24_02040 [Cognatishimia sp. SS12]|uniref:hypothetical protein n=1 Tax=Cognatishimia sp. SS12 TaxID=2979465 RepID=UPI00233108BF|nr:hypothetical protein [Cognatishimia sp. SS12]MDC0737050.1 hypothetical protein [Cognatishimia sp. SS12]